MASTKTLAISSLGESVSLKNGFASSQRGATRMSGRSAGSTSTCGVYDDEVRVPIIGVAFEFGWSWRADMAIGLVALDGVEEVLGALGLGVVEELIGRAGFHDLAVGHKHDAVGYAAGEVHLVRDDDHRHALLGQTDHDFEHLVDHLGVKGARGLVKEHGLGLHGE